VAGEEGEEVDPWGGGSGAPREGDLGARARRRQEGAAGDPERREAGAGDAREEAGRGGWGWII
jgi:hypothetical protein